ncbi:MAG: hypothetical protein ABIJ21_03265 [Nanoarchaeota archaeon]
MDLQKRLLLAGVTGLALLVGSCTAYHEFVPHNSSSVSKSIEQYYTSDTRYQEFLLSGRYAYKSDSKVLRIGDEYKKPDQQRFDPLPEYIFYGEKAIRLTRKNEQGELIDIGLIIRDIKTGTIIHINYQGQNPNVYYLVRLND